MDFFARQDKARRNTKVLVFYFALAVLSLIVAVDLAVWLIFAGVEAKESLGESTFAWSLGEVTLGTSLATLFVISAGSVFKTLQLSSGGSVVAELLEGRLVASNTIDADERKLLNIVEEMSIASGVPVPQVYVMDNESGINAFAAGHSSSDAAVSVTRGCIKLLNRDELQGVIAHEFSHVLNGDMKLNLRLMGLIFGILCLTVIGRVLARTRGRKNPLPLLGLALIVIGWAGVLFGRLIQAAVSRQRELLADASAVQFTRNPGGLAGALKKIGGLDAGSQIVSPHAEETSHLFFANGLSDSFFGLMSTHPPLEERIRALDPSFDGKYPVVREELVSAPPLPDEPPIPRPGMIRMPAPVPALTIPQAAARIPQEALVGSIGEPQSQHLGYATEFPQEAPGSLETSVRDPLGASALLYAFLLTSDPSAQGRQLEALSRVTSQAIRDETLKIWPAVRGMPARTKIPLIDISLPALRRLSPQQFEQLRAAVKALIESDDQTDLFEFMLQKIVTRHLETYFFPIRRPVTQFYDIRPLASDCGILLSAIAYAGHTDATQAHAAFTQGVQLLNRAAQIEIPWLPPEQCDLAKIDSALHRLNQAVPQIKKNVLTACSQAIATDNIMTEVEAELLRAIADALDCPVPPVLASANPSQ